MIDHFPIHHIKAGDLVWECEGGEDALLLALSDARAETYGTGVDTIDIATGKPVHLFENDRVRGYGPKLYRGPQYTKPNWAELLEKLATLQSDLSTEALKQAKARESGLQLAATQYSESRDHWKAEHDKAQAEISRLQMLISEACGLAERGGQTGIELSQRILGLLQS
jgi:hypothetical protein